MSWRTWTARWIDRLSSFRPGRAGSRRKNLHHRGPTFARPRPEQLEDRVVPSTNVVDVGGLRFFSLYNPFDQPQTDEYKLVGEQNTVQIGFTPVEEESFLPLINVNLTAGDGSYGVFDLTSTEGGQFTLSVSAAIDVVVQGGTPIPIWQPSGGFFNDVTFSIPQLLSSNGVSLDPTQSTPFTFHGVSITSTALLLNNPDDGDTSDAQVLMQGTAAFGQYGGIDLSPVTAAINGGNYLIAQATGLTLTGLTVSVGSKPLSLGGMAAASFSGTIGYSHLDSGDEFIFALGATLSSTPQGTSTTSYQGLNNVSANIGLTLFVPEDDAGSAAIQGLTASLAGQFKIASLQVSTDAGNPLVLTYTAASDQWTFAGGVTVTLAGSSIDVFFGFSDNPSTPGLVFQGGQLQTLNATVNGTINLGPAEFTTDNNGLTFSYQKAGPDNPELTADQFAMYGTLTLNIDSTGGKKQSISADLGTSSDPGLVLLTTGDDVKQINMHLSGTFDLFGVTLVLEEAGMAYGTDSQGAYYDVSGTLSLRTFFSAAVTLEPPGLMIRNGSWQLDDFEFKVQNVPLGPFSIHDLEVNYSTTGTAGDYDVDVALDVGMPGGWVVGGEVTVVNGEVADLSLSLELGEEPIPIPGTGFYITYLSATVDNINDWANWEVQGQVDVVYGEPVTVFGKTVTLFAAEGSFTLDKDEFVLTVDVQVGAYSTGPGSYSGVAGSGKGSFTFDWGAQQYSADISVSMVDDVFNGDLSLSFDGSGDVTIKAEVSVNVPPQVPFVGGKTLGSIDFAMEYRPNDGHPKGFVAAWISVDIFGTHDVGFKYDLVTKDFSILNTSAVNGIEKQIENPPPQTYYYAQQFTVPAGATSAWLAFGFPSPPADLDIAVQADDGSFIDQGDFDKNAISVSYSTNGTTPEPLGATVLIEWPSSSNVPLPVSTYTLRAASTTQFNTSDVTFSSNFYYALPTVNVTAALPAVATSPIVSVPLGGTVDVAFGPQAGVNLYLDIDGSGYDGVPIADDLPLTPDSSGNWTITGTFDLTGLLPLPYYVYAVINDGTNQPVYSAYSTAVLPQPPVAGQLTDSVTAQALSGFQVYLDANNNGQFDPGEPTTVTNTNGFYDFWDVTAETPFGVGVLVPNSYEFDDQGGTATNPHDGLVYDGSVPLSVNFSLGRLPYITGTTFNDANGNGVMDTGEQPVGGVAVYIDTNNDGRYEVNEPAVTSSTGGTYSFVALAPNAAYTVGLAQPGPAAYYSFDSVSGTTVSDTAGSGEEHDGTLMGGTAVGTATSFDIAPRPYGSADNQVLQLNGTTQFVDAGFSPDLQPGTGAFSVAAWVYVDDATQLQDIAGALGWESGAFDGWTFRIPGDRLLYVQLTQQGTSAQQGTLQRSYLFGNTPLQDDTWYHVAFTYDGTSDPDAIRIYVNGLLDAVSTNAGNMPADPDVGTANNASFNVGNSGGDAIDVPFGGYLDDVAVWDYELRSDQVAALAFGTTASVPGVSSLLGNSSLFQTGPTPVPPGTAAVTTTANSEGFVGQPPVVNLGTLPYGSIRGTLVGQAMQGGVLSPSSEPLAGWTVNLLQNGQVVSVTTSAADGTYTFTGVQPGSYEVQPVVPQGWRDVAPGQLDLQLSDAGLVSTGVVPNALAVADFNGDGWLDLAVSSASAGSVRVLYGSNGAQFGSPVSSNISFSDAVSLVTGDFNGDGSPDLAVLSASGYIDLLLSTAGQQSFALQSHAFTLPSGVVPVALAVGDFDGDGKDDLAASFAVGTSSGPGFEALLATGQTHTYRMSTGYLPGSLAAGDVNLDGRLDVVIMTAATWANDAAEPFVALGDGTGNFALPSRPDEMLLNRPTFLVVEDVNGDGMPDLVSGGTAPPGTPFGAAAYLPNLGGGNFGIALNTHFIYSTSNAPPLSAAALGDLNGDLRPDFVGVQQATQSPEVIVPNEGSGIDVFGAPQTFTFGTSSSVFTGAALADVNSDGLLDLLLTDSGNGGVEVVLNRSALGLNESVTAGQAVTGADFTYAQTGQLGGLVFDDVNRDGRREPGEAGRAGVAVTLERLQGGGFVPTGLASVTGATGAYAFDGLPAGTYRVCLADAAGRSPTVPGSDQQVAGVARGTAAVLPDVGTRIDWLLPVAGPSVQQGGTLTLPIRRTAAGAAEQGLVFRLGAGAPAGASIDPVTGVLTWSPSNDQAPGDYAVTVLLTDPFQPTRTESETFAVTVVAAPTAPRPQVPAELGYVLGLYEAVLGREADDAGAAVWAAAIRGGASREQIAAALWNSAEHRGQQVDLCYQTYFQRQADAVGRAFWVSQLQGGMSEDDVAARFLASAEYAALHPGDGAFIDALYADVLDRAGDAAGRAAHLQSLAGSGRAAVIAAFLASPEHYRLLLDAYYADLLGRAPDQPGEAAWLQVMQSGAANADQVAQSFLSSEEFFARMTAG